MALLWQPHAAKNKPKTLIVCLSSPTPKTVLFTQKSLINLYGTEISATLAYLCLNLVVMAMSFAP